MENKIYAVSLGILLFCFVVGLINLAFQKSPEELAKEKCYNLLGTSNALRINTKITVYIEGVPYECK